MQDLQKLIRYFFYVFIFILLRAKGVNHSNPEKESNDTNNNHSVNQSTLCVIKSQIFQWSTIMSTDII